MRLSGPRLRALLGATAAAALLGAAPAHGSPVLVVDGNRVSRVEDPYLPPRAQTDLPAVFSLAPAPEAPAARASGRGPTVNGTVRQALLDGTITGEDHDNYRRVYEEARSLRRRLSGARRAELGSVIATLERIADRELLTPSRMPPLFLQLSRNVEFWRTAPFPGGGARVRFARSPLIFQYYPGRGLQLQPLANFGRANQLWRDATENGKPTRGALRELLDAMVYLRVDRGGFTAWEYMFKFAGGSPPWVSGLAQGTAIQALARGSQLLEEPSYLEVARSALGAFEAPPPVGVRVPAQGGDHYLIYSFNSRLRVLNGFLQGVIGLRDFAQIAADPRAQALFEAGDRAARESVPRFDTGAWSLYAQTGRESDLGYHRLVRDFLQGLCDRTQAEVYCGTAKRFTRYLYESPRLEYLGAAGARARRPVRIRFRLSKVSRVSIRITQSKRVKLESKQSFGHGTRAFAWTPPRSGRYAVRIEAADLRNHHAVVRGSVTVRRRRR